MASFDSFFKAIRSICPLRGGGAKRIVLKSICVFKCLFSMVTRGFLLMDRFLALLN
jgi:hypothetical protein